MQHPLFRSLLSIAVLTLAGLGAGSSSLHAQSPRPKADARRLVVLSRQALAETALTAARFHGPRYEPFWSTFDEMARSLDRIGTAIRNKDSRLFGEIRTGTRALEAMITVWRRTGAESEAVSTRLDAFSVSYRLLRSQYGGEALRARRGGDLTEAENRQLAVWQQTQRRLAVRFATLQAEAARRQDREMQEELRHLAEQARRIAEAEPTLFTYLETLQINDEMQGEWDGNSYFVEPADAPAWEETYEVVEDLSTGNETGFVMAADLSSGQTWSFLETETEIPADLGFAAEETAELETAPAYVVEAPAAPETTPVSEESGTAEPAEIWAGSELSNEEHVETVEVLQPEETAFEADHEETEPVEAESLDAEPPVLEPAEAAEPTVENAEEHAEGSEVAEDGTPDVLDTPEAVTGENAADIADVADVADVAVVEDIEVIEDAPAAESGGEERPPHPLP